MKSKVGSKSAKSSKKSIVDADSAVLVIVEVSYVGNGGNTGSGVYHYSCTPDPVHVTAKDTAITYVMSPLVGPQFVFTGLYSSDSLYEPQLSKKPSIKSKGRVMLTTHANKVATLINVSLQIQDTTKQVRISCDPQVTNDPNPSG
ncbi:hypothetical protein [Rhodanobacter sp. MP1X3]|uniref:hypothetical protein n=1 Tax=Rhodanobacter sp. MP1X3 TaxID=2723086 RepID=UPI00160B4115|nr:hypothetical protein [Rhodanobacter sp. MP1X3]MBB6243731.1 hypothetical protein [Rhodanobacter sp. MP1X3]